MLAIKRELEGIPLSDMQRDMLLEMEGAGTGVGFPKYARPGPLYEP